jgi:hypothetical protein
MGPSTAAAAHPVHRSTALTLDTRAKISNLSRDGTRDTTHSGVGLVWKINCRAGRVVGRDIGRSSEGTKAAEGSGIGNKRPEQPSSSSGAVCDLVSFPQAVTVVLSQNSDPKAPGSRR